GRHMSDIGPILVSILPRVTDRRFAKSSLDRNQIGDDLIHKLLGGVLNDEPRVPLPLRGPLRFGADEPSRDELCLATSRLTRAAGWSVASGRAWLLRSRPTGIPGCS